MIVASKYTYKSNPKKRVRKHHLSFVWKLIYHTHAFHFIQSVAMLTSIVSNDLPLYMLVKNYKCIYLVQTFLFERAVKL